MAENRTDPGALAALTRLDDEQLFDAVRARGSVPTHVAVIMDGNGRWAKRRFLPRAAGHRAGRHAVRRCLRACRMLGIRYLTLYTFSQENFKRPAAEVRALWHFLQEALLAEVEELDEQGVRLLASGELERLPERAQQALQGAIDRLSHNRELTLNLALAYGGRQEILHAAMALARRLESGELTADQVDEEQFRQGLYSPEIPDPDLVIRTSGEARLSNFLLWESAYSEILITPVLWPDFRERDMMLAVADYQCRERRFGALLERDQDAGRPGGGDLLDPERWKRLLKGKR